MVFDCFAMPIVCYFSKKMMQKKLTHSGNCICFCPHLKRRGRHLLSWAVWPIPAIQNSFVKLAQMRGFLLTFLSEDGNRSGLGRQLFLICT